MENEESDKTLVLTPKNTKGNLPCHVFELGSSWSKGLHREMQSASADCTQRCTGVHCSWESQAGSKWKQREAEQPGLDLQYREADEGRKRVKLVTLGSGSCSLLPTAWCWRPINSGTSPDHHRDGNMMQ